MLHRKFRIFICITIAIVILIANSVVFAADTNNQSDKNNPVVLLNDEQVLTSQEQTNLDEVWARMVREAEAAVTPEKIAEIERKRVEEKEFLANLTPETLWEAYLEANPEIFEMQISDDEIMELKQEIAILYEEIAADNPVSSPQTAYTKHFSYEDGVLLNVLLAIESCGFSARENSESRFPDDELKRDAYRHYTWNYYAVNSLLVGITQNGRLNSTRIYLTNYELATNILRRTSSLRTDNPTSAQKAQAIELRNAILNTADIYDWQAFFTVTYHDEYGHGFNDLMDLWNNEMGRQDGVTYGLLDHVPLEFINFRDRWDNDELIKTDINNSIGVNWDRRQHIFYNNWYVPVR